MNSQELTAFIVTAECASFSKAQDKLFLSKQAIRKKISSLESELGTPLLLRTHSGVMLTEAGKIFYADAQKVLDAINEATNHCRSVYYNETELRLATPAHPRLMLDDVIVEFMNRFPNVRIRLVMQPNTTSLKDVLNGAVDIAEYTYSEKLNRIDVGYTKTKMLQVKCLMEPNHPLSGREKIEIEELSGQRVAVNAHDAILIAQIEEMCSNISLERFDAYDMQQINNLCFNGGIVISKATFIDYMSPLVTVPLATDYRPQGTIIYRKRPSPMVREFVRIVEKHYPQEPEEQT